MPRVLVTGAAGFIGGHLMVALRAAGLQAVGLDLAGDPSRDIRQVDLLDELALHQQIADIGLCDAVVHLAAIAHGQTPPSGHTCLSFNVQTTRNLLTGIDSQNPLFILASSVAVYGEAGRPERISAADQPEPATEYGASKLECESILRDSRLTNVAILRFAPVYDEKHVRDVAKRVYLPGLKKIRMRLAPEPRYALCHADTAVAQVVSILQQGRSGRSLRNVADEHEYGQHELATWFTGPQLPVPRLAFAPLAILGRMLPGRRGYAVRCTLAKLLETHLFGREPLKLP